MINLFSQFLDCFPVKYTIACDVVNRSCGDSEDKLQGIFFFGKKLGDPNANGSHNQGIQKGRNVHFELGQKAGIEQFTGIVGVHDKPETGADPLAIADSDNSMRDGHAKNGNPCDLLDDFQFQE